MNVFSYCLKVGKSYGDALGLYNKYLGKTNSKSNECNNIKTGDDTQTMFNALSGIKMMMTLWSSCYFIIMIF